MRILGLDIDPGRSLSSGRPKAGFGGRDDEDSAALMRRDQILVDARFRAPKRSLRRSKKKAELSSRHTIRHPGRMPDDPAFTLRQLDQARGDL